MKCVMKYKIYRVRETVEGIIFGENAKEIVLDPYFEENWPDGFDSVEQAMEILSDQWGPNREYTILPSIKIPF